MSKLFKSGVIGLGRAGWQLHVEPMLAHGGYQITAVADPNAQRRVEAVEKTGCQGYADIDALLAQADCELVAVATPSHFHYADAKKVLESGRHCVLEKPMALTHAETQELVALAKNKGVLLTVFHTHLFLPEFYHLKEVAESGILGRIFNFRGLWANYMRRWDWQTLKKNGGGLLNNWGSHLLSVALPLLGSKATHVSANLQHVKDAGDTEDHVEILLRTESGATANLTVTTACAFPGVKWMLLGDKGTLVSDGTTSQLKYYDPKKAPLPPLDETHAVPGRHYNTETLPWIEETRPAKPSHAVPAFYQNVADALRGEAELIVKAEDAAEVIRIIELAKKD